MTIRSSNDAPLTIRACWCGHQALVPYSRFYRLCEECGTLVSQYDHAIDVSHVNDDMTDFYGRDYWFSHQESDLGFVNIYERARRDLSERCPHWARTLLKYRTPPGRVLELGSAHGGFVALLRLIGFDATGLELSPAIVEIARELFGVPMLEGPIEDQPMPSGSLDVVALMDVLEHLPNPASTMGACVRALGADGFLLVQTPQFPEGVSFAEMEASGHRFLEVLTEKEHLYLFSRRAVLRLFAALGFAHIVFEPSLFAHYDMFLVVSRQPLETIDADTQAARVLSTASGRMAQAHLDLFARAERAEAQYLLADLDRQQRLEVAANLEARLRASELDRQARLEVLQVSEADRAARLRQIEVLTAQLLEAEADRAARGDALRVMTAQLSESERVRQACLATTEELRAVLQVSEADRTARLEVIMAADTRLQELSRELASLRASLDAIKGR